MAILFVIFVVGVLLCLYSSPKQQQLPLQTYRSTTQELVLRETIVETPHGTEIHRELIVRRDVP